MRRISAPLACAAFALALLGGCMGQQDPDSFTDDVRKDFITGCVEMATADNEAAEVATIDDPEAFCGCAADAIDENVDFDDVKDLNSELRNDAGPLSEEIQEAYASCLTDA